MSNLKFPDKKTLIHARRWVWVFLILSIVSAITYGLSGLPKAGKQIDIDSIQIIEVALGAHKYYIPKSYVGSRSKDSSDGTIMLDFQYPSFLPLSESTQEMWDKGEKWRHLRVVVGKILTNRPMNELINERIKILKAYEVTGQEYGLEHHTQPDGYVKDHSDIWIAKENGEPVSYIICNKKLTPRSIPQCTSYIRTEKEFLTIDYNKKLLPEWYVLQSKISDAVQSFQSPENAQNFLRKRVEYSQTLAKEKQK